MATRSLFFLALVWSLAGTAAAQENHEGVCKNGVDDDGDGSMDCDDDECASLDLCRAVSAQQQQQQQAQPQPQAQPQQGQPQAQPQQGQPQAYGQQPQAAPAAYGTTTGIQAGPTQPATPAVDEAEEEFYPQRHASQPLTYRQGMLVPILGLRWTHSAFSSAVVDPLSFDLILAVEYGILDFLQVWLYPLGIQLSPSVQYLNPVLGGMVRFFGTSKAEMGLATQIHIPVEGSTAWDFWLPLRFHLGRAGRIDLLPLALTVLFGDLDTYVSVGARARLAFQIADYVFFGARTGVSLGPVDYDIGSVPLAFFAGANIPGGSRGPLMELFFETAFPTFYQFDGFSEDTNTEFWQVTLNARMFLYLL